jgi:hypothetical protein
MGPSGAKQRTLENQQIEGAYFDGQRTGGKSPALSRLRTFKLRVGMYHGASSVRALAAPAYEGRFILVYLERPLALAA